MLYAYTLQVRSDGGVTRYRGRESQGQLRYQVPLAVACLVAYIVQAWHRLLSLGRAEYLCRGIDRYYPIETMYYLIYLEPTSPLPPTFCYYYST